MVWVVLISVAVVLVAAFGALVTARLPYDPMAEPVHTTPDTGLPGEPVAADVDAVRFDTAARGYRMSEVDDVLDRLQATLAGQEEELARLRTGEPAAPGTPGAEWHPDAVSDDDPASPDAD